MKKAKWLIWAVLIAVFALTFAACSSVKKHFSSKTYDADAVKVYTNAEKLYFDGYDIDSTRQNLVVLSKIDGESETTKVFDYVARSVVQSLLSTASKTHNVSLRSVNVGDETVPFFFVEEITLVDNTPTGYKYTLYNMAGGEVDSYTTEIADTAPVSTNADLVVFDNTVYRVSDNGSMSKVTETSDLAAAFPAFDEVGKDYYYDFTANSIAVYGKGLDLVYYYELPAYAENMVAFALNNGDLFVQYEVELFDTDSKYDIIKQNAAGDRKKYSLTQQLIKVKKGKGKSLKSDYYYMLGFNKTNNPDIFNGLNKKYENIAIAYVVKDKRIQNAISERKIVVMKNNGKASAVVNDTFGKEQMYQVISDSRLILTDAQNRDYLYDYSGNKLGEVTNMIDYTEKLIVAADSVYDMDLKKVLDMKTNGYTYVDTVGNNVIYTDVDGIVYLFDGSQKALIAGDVALLSLLDDDLFTVRSTIGDTIRYTLYNGNGKEIAGISETPNNIVVRGTKNGSKLISYRNDDGANVFYLVK